MSERIIFEARLIETDDDIRVEMKGDKGHMHTFHLGRHRHHFGHRDERMWSRWERRFRRGWCFGPWWDWDETPDSTEKPKSTGESASTVI